MGNLKPGASYIYERADGITYAREVGSLHREAIGWDADVDPNGLHQRLIKDSHEWREILIAAKNNPSLQEAVDRVKLLYHLSKKEHGQE
jgi:hypothetical protein